MVCCLITVACSDNFFSEGAAWMSSASFGILKIISFYICVEYLFFLQINAYFYGDANQLRKSSIPLRD